MTQGKIVFGSATLEAGKGGIARVGRMTARALIDHGLEIDILSFLDESPKVFGWQQIRAMRGSKLSFLLGCHLAAPTCQSFVCDYVGVARALPRIWPLRRRYAVWIHGIEVWEQLKPDAHRIIRGAHTVLANSAFTLRTFEQLHGPLRSARVCWLATEADAEVSPKLERRGEAPTALMVGRVELGEGRKGHDQVLEVWPHVVKSVPGARLAFVGGGTGLSRLVARAATSPVSKSILVKGFVTEQELSALWREASLFVLPSRQEGFGIVYVEAMRYGLPVVASLHDAGAEINLNGKTGINVDLNYPSMLAEALVGLLKNQQLRAAMGQNGVRRWKEHFTYPSFRQRLLATLTETGFL
jgi:phosphatidyl-myo-inositol dimannoside synthase